MTRYGEDNDKKRGTSWLLDHCAICGDPLPMMRFGRRRGQTICPCTEQLQACRRAIREMPFTPTHRQIEARPDFSSIETKLGA